ncbi:MAG: paraslipin, partial [Merismopediaceae bacterium]|nr:paraslipin [Merismopediaceae bacterium]
RTDPNAKEALQFLLAQQYLEMASTVGQSESSKVMFIDPRSIVATLEGVKSVINTGGDLSSLSEIEQALEKVDRHRAG